jgi:hypothetical protein
MINTENKMKTTTNLVVSEQIPDRSLIYQNYVFISISDAKGKFLFYFLIVCFVFHNFHYYLS